MLFQTVLVNWFGTAIFLLNSVITTTQKGCVLNVTNESTEKFLPVPLYNSSAHYELAVPLKGALDLKQGAKISLLCPGLRNYITATNSNITTVSCIQASTVEIFNKKIEFEDIQCKKISKGGILKTDERCGNNRGDIYKIGYQVTKKHWITLIEVCYVPETGNTLYTHHTLHGKAIKHASKASYRPGFSTSGLNDDVTASVAYKKPYQKATFNKILKSAKMAENYINSKSYLARGHLSPDADFLLATSQYSTYYYINTAPQWQRVNGGSWKSIESTVRKISERYENLQVITGTHDVLTYQDASGTPQAIFLVSNDKIPVPKYFWKLIYDPESQKAIVFVILNDPFIESVKEGDIFCQDVCQESGYRNTAWRKLDTGYVFCCDVDDFQNAVEFASGLPVKGILNN